jgi:Na+-transporting NADH:ubiquinone oxidoreductase subunit C
MNKESFLYVVIFTFVVAFVFVFIIALADNATSERVAQNQKLVTAQAFLNAVGEPETDGITALSTFADLFSGVEGESIARANINGQNLLVKQFSGQGLWGTVTGVIAVDDSVQRIIGLDIISHAETPGLGGRIEEDWFKDQFRGESIPADGLSVRKGEGGSDSDPNNGVVDGVTGASLTSASMEVMINNEIETLRKEAGK